MPGYSNVLIDHFGNPRNAGRLESPDATGRGGDPNEGVFVLLHLRISDGRVAEARFQTFGCGPAIAAGSLLTEMIAGRSVEDCLAVTEEQLTEALGGLPKNKRWCARIAIVALQDALTKYREGSDDD